MTSPRRRLTALSTAGVLTLGALIGCQIGSGNAAPTSAPSASSTPSITARTAPTQRAASSADDAINKVLAISLDGLNPSAITKLGAKGAPNFYRLMREGSYTLNARTEYEQTRTLPNHTGMLTGRRIDRKKKGHGVTFNSDTGTTVHKAAKHYVASVFDVVHDRGGSTALYSAKTKFALYSRTWNTHGRADKVGSNQGKRKIDRVVLNTDDAKLVASLNAELRRSARTFTFLHIALPDEAGHAYGFMGSRYLTAVKQTDKLLGSVLATIDSRPALKKQLLVMVTADHGGKGASHSNRKSINNYRIPFFTWGPRVPAHRDLYALNPTFRDPKTGRPSYSGKQPVRNGDVANLATDALDLPTVPGSTLNRPRTLTVVK